MNVAVIAASSVVPQMDLREGVDRLRGTGLDVTVQANCGGEYLYFAGNDQERANAFYGAATSRAIDILWCAGGGSGAQRILPLLESLPVPPRKTLLGFSDATSLLSFVRTRWSWRTIHAPMVATLANCSEVDFAGAVALARGDRPATPWGTWQLHWIISPKQPIEATIVGGNLTVWTSLVGTAFTENNAGKILFFEDVGEQPYRIDRTVTQLYQAGQFNEVAAVMLGAFTDCDDRVKLVRLRSDPGVRVPLRREWRIDEALAETFGRLGVPVATGLPMGHGPFTTPLPLGVKVTLTTDGILKL